MRIEYIREMKRSYMTVTGEGVGKAMKPACWLKPDLRSSENEDKIHGWSTCILL